MVDATVLIGRMGRARIGPAVPWLAAGAALAGAILLSGHVLRAATGVEAALLYRDANAIAGQPFYYGFLEYATASILLMSGAILGFETLAHRRRGPPAAVAALACLSALTLLLGADDLLMLHESAPYIGLGPEHFLAVHGLLLVVVLALDPAEAMRPRAAVAGVGLFALGLAAVEDVMGMQPLGVGLEDYLEIVGFSFWSVYVVARAAMR